MVRSLKPYFVVFAGPTSAAFAIAFLVPFGMGLYLSFTEFTTLIGGLVLGYTWQSILNAILKNWGQTVISDWRLGFAGLVMLINWQLAGYMMIIYIAGLQNVPPELNEAAEIDGAGKWRRLRSVTIPIMPSITICLFLTLANTFKMYDQNLALTSGRPGKETEMAALDIVSTMYNKVGQEGIAQAMAVVFFLIVSLIALVQLRATRSKEVDQ